MVLLSVMKLQAYLDHRKESQKAFSERAHILQQTVNAICNGAATKTDTAIKIVAATAGVVGFSDLTGDRG